MNPRCERRGRFLLENLIGVHELALDKPRNRVKKDSIINLTTGSRDTSDEAGISGPSSDTGSEHGAIEWRLEAQEPRVQQEWKTKGRALKEVLGKGKEDANEGGKHTV